MPHRFFIPPEWLTGSAVAIAGPQARQIARVLRMRPGDRLVVLDDSGWEFEVHLLAVQPELVRGQVVGRRLAAGEPRTRITLYQGMLKSDRFEFVLQKGTELGIVEFAPLVTARTVALDRDAPGKKRARWQSIVQEAAEQSRRGRKPVLRPAMPFAQACAEVSRSAGLKLLPWEEEGRTNLRRVLRDGAPAGKETAIHLFVGPEGGLTREEVDLARGYGLVPVTLGQRILRAETAGLVAAAAILYERGDLE
ncbi:MAG: 16S rRNA (uracil(1498)-N(3))-methyltransferase [Anaerolineae bacterium]|nr:16S rRNA (uracil(1498)-N(3))-methyltransferase [Anaerolineae bacterium]